MDIVIYKNFKRRQRTQWPRLKKEMEIQEIQNSDEKELIDLSEL